MNEKYKILIERLDYFINVKNEIDRILFDYETRKIIYCIKFNDGKINMVKELFNIQNELCIIIYKYQYTVSDFLSSFIYEFDRQDEVSMYYLFSKIKEEPNFLI